MFSDKDRGELIFLFKALTSWMICSLIMVLIFTIIICKTSLSSSYIGYISSFISFVAAVFAGLSASKYRKGSKLYTGIFASLFIVIVLLTIGFIIEGNKMSSAGLISVASFSIAGVMLGSNVLTLFLGTKSKKGRNKHKRAAKLT